MRSKIIFGIAGCIVASMAQGSAADLIADYRSAGTGPFSVADGGAAWVQGHQASAGAETRSCASCHGTDLSRPGRHIKTEKPIEPMALSVNPKRLTDSKKKVEKWFRRNCRWTLGRECTPQEKGDFIRFMTSQ